MITSQDIHKARVGLSKTLRDEFEWLAQSDREFEKLKEEIRMAEFFLSYAKNYLPTICEHKWLHTPFDWYGSYTCSKCGKSTDWTPERFDKLAARDG